MARQADLDELERQMDFMRAKLSSTAKLLENQPVAIPYDNGGGQCGIREHPAFSAYEKLLKSYQSAMRDHDALGGDAGSTHTDDGLSKLRNVVRLNVV